MDETVHEIVGYERGWLLILSLLVAIISLILGPEVTAWISTRIGFDRTLNYIWAILRWPLILAALLLDLALIYHFVPNVKQRFRFLSPGAVFAVMSCALASFNLHVSNFDSYARSYGTLGAAMVLLLWLFVSAFVVIWAARSMRRSIRC